MNRFPSNLAHVLPIPSPCRKIIYDFGANNGDNIPYYLKKADLVVAVEANPLLCQQIERRFSFEIRQDRLRIENCVLVHKGEAAHVPFYIHKRHHVLSQLPQPDKSTIASFEKVLLPSQPVMQIVRRYGPPYYVKIDMEGCEETILEELLRNGITPPFLSTGTQSMKTFALLTGTRYYTGFQLLDGASIARKYKDHPISQGEFHILYSFPHHSAGPFGEDLAGEWMNADDLSELLRSSKLDWMDIHATSLIQPNPTSRTQKRWLRFQHMCGWLSAQLRSLLK